MAGVQQETAGAASKRPAEEGEDNDRAEPAAKRRQVESSGAGPSTEAALSYQEGQATITPCIAIC